MSTLARKISKIRSNASGAVFTFFSSGRSVYVFLSGLSLIILGACVMYASLSSQEALASSGGWNTFVAVSGTSQWMSATFLVSSGFIVLSLNYLPRLEGEV